MCLCDCHLLVECATLTEYCDGGAGDLTDEGDFFFTAYYYVYFQTSAFHNSFACSTFYVR